MTDPRIDAWANAVTALGTSRDKSTHTVFVPRGQMTDPEAQALYAESGLAARIVDRLPDDATKEGFEIVGSDIEFDWRPILSQFETLDVLPTLADGWRWARLYRGAIVPLIVSDGLSLDMPLNLERARNLAALHVIEAPYVQPIDWVPGLGSRGFGSADYYDVHLPFGKDGKERRIHRTRVIRFDGLKLSPMAMLERDGWGLSVLERVRTELAQLGESLGYARNILHEISLRVFAMEGFTAKSKGSAVDREELQSIFEIIKWSMDNLHMFVMDSNDRLEERTRSVQGIASILMAFIDALVRATDMPRTVLLGEQPGGLGASASSELQAWYDYVASQQRRVLTVAVNRVLEVLLSIHRVRTGEMVPSEWEIQWKPLWTPSEEQRTSSRLRNAQARALDASILSQRELRTDPSLAHDYTTDVAINTDPPLSSGAMSGAGGVPGSDPVAEDDIHGVEGEADPNVITDPAAFPSDLVSLREAATMLSCSPSTVLAIGRRGEVRLFRVGSRWRVSRAEVQQAIASASGLIEDPDVDEESDE